EARDAAWSGRVGARVRWRRSVLLRRRKQREGESRPPAQASLRDPCRLHEQVNEAALTGEVRRRLTGRAGATTSATTEQPSSLRKDVERIAVAVDNIVSLRHLLLEVRIILLGRPSDGCEWVSAVHECLCSARSRHAHIAATIESPRRVRK